MPGGWWRGAAQPVEGLPGCRACGFGWEGCAAKPDLVGHWEAGAHTCTFPFGPLKHESLARCKRRHLCRGPCAGAREGAGKGAREEGGSGPGLGSRFVCQTIFWRALTMTPNLQPGCGRGGREAARCAPPPPGALQARRRADLRRLLGTGSQPPPSVPLTACHFSADAGVRAREGRTREERGGGAGAGGLLPLHPGGPW